MADNNLTFKCNIEFHEPVGAYTLSLGGWLPVAFTQTPHVLLDRNVISILEQIGTSLDRGDHKANKWWFEFLNSSDFTLHPVLSAMEGKNKITPSLEEFILEFKSNSKLLNEKLPKANTIIYNEESFRVFYEIIENLSYRSIREKEFLVTVAPLINQRVSDKNLLRIESEILEKANKHEVSSFSLIMLAVLSCLYENKHGDIPSIGKKLIKPTVSYNKNDAHNALSDLRCLEFLIAGQSFFGNVASFITRDKALAAFWCAINPKKHNYVDKIVSYNVELTKILLPRICEEEIDLLAERLVQNNL